MDVLRSGLEVLQVATPYLEAYWLYVQEGRTATCDQIDIWLQPYRPWQILIGAIVTTVLVLLYVKPIWGAIVGIQELGVRQWALKMLRCLPMVTAKIQQKKDELTADLEEQKREKDNSEVVDSLPSRGIPTALVLAKLVERYNKDVSIADGTSAVSGTVYFVSKDHKRFLDTIYSHFSHTNPLHADCFPSVRRLEAEVVAMVANMLGKGSTQSDVCGCMTSGGTESILLAMKASRDYMRARKGISKPEILIARSAHAAYWKAADYFNMKLVVVPVGQDYRLHADTVRRYMTRNTAVVVASAPNYPHGVMDNIADIAELCRSRGVLLHVDACLGGFVLPFAKKLGYAIPPFDFSLPGVTSMSVDTHKFGMAHKGTSIVLYRSKELRRYQYSTVTEWTGGIYVSPSMAGSRSGALIATAWASLVHLGESGFLSITNRIMKAARTFQDGISEIPELELVGQPDMSVVAFKFKDQRLNIYHLNDLMTKKGWHLNALQSPPALHFCFTAAHVDVAHLLLADLKTTIQQLIHNPEPLPGGSAPIYGMAATLPDRGLVGEFLATFQDAMLDP